ncbi:MAG: 1-deoxy-D-xylulose-5-phosphate synthase [Treponema sp.]|nr:1-deoxy-D-xylulose-5-phosphate synthase [Treponema sp.]
MFITLLSSINSPADIKSLSFDQLDALAAEIRRSIIDVVGKNGGHLASNLGLVELTIALHRVFNSPQDALIFDVSHQCYTHKLLTGRYSKFSTLRQKDGLSGFTKQSESVHDFFDNGHSSTSISSALGLEMARKILGKSGKSVCIIGDGALTGGLALEALSNAGQISKNLIVILNDNQMSIDQNTGAISRYLSSLTMTRHYQSFRHNIDWFVEKVPGINRILTKFVHRFKRGLKGFLLSNNFFTDLGFEYVGPLNGHDIRELVLLLNRVKHMNRPVVVHVVTKKGKGYSPAEHNPERFHGIGPFITTDGTVEKFDNVSFTEAFSSSLMALAEKRNDIACITAAMAKGTGLASFARHYPDRFFDVGIAEEHAVTFAGGLAKGGILPIVCIYSTFIQRAVDQLIHDISLQNFKAIFVLDRAGAVPSDGETHQGIFDIALFRPIPGLRIMSPASARDLDLCLNYAAENEKSTVIRYPKMSCPTELDVFSKPVEEGRGILVPAFEYETSFAPDADSESISRTKKILFVCTGGMFSEVLNAGRALSFDDVIADIYTLRFIKPFDFNYFLDIAKKYEGIVFVEDGIITGGISEYLASLCAESGITNFCVKAFQEKYYQQGSRAEVCEEAGLSPDELKKSALELIKK